MIDEALTVGPRRVQFEDNVQSMERDREQDDFDDPISFLANDPYNRARRAILMRFEEGNDMSYNLPDDLLMATEIAIEYGASVRARRVKKDVAPPVNLINWKGTKVKPDEPILLKNAPKVMSSRGQYSLGSWV